METWINLVFAAVCDQCNCTTAFSQLCATLSSSLAAHKRIRVPLGPWGRLPRRHCSAYMLSVIMWAPYVECCLIVNAVMPWKSAKASSWMVPLRLIRAESRSSSRDLRWDPEDGKRPKSAAVLWETARQCCFWSDMRWRDSAAKRARHSMGVLLSTVYELKRRLYTCVDNSCI